jgi:cytochrome c oxidase assembly protein subunit 15
MNSLWVHRLAVLTAAATFPLLFIGGLVTSKGAGLAVPDWPTTFGYNMFLYPWSKMVGGIFYEHSHRLVASVVGILTLALSLLIWTQETRNWMRWLGVAALAGVIVQGVIGGLRVVLLESTLAIIHGPLAQAFFALTVSLVLFTSREWKEKPQKIEMGAAGKLQRLCLLTTALIYLQGVFGAVVRFTGALSVVHILLALIVSVHVILLAGRVLQLFPDQGKLKSPAIVLGGLLLLQLALGIGAYLGRFAPFGWFLLPAATVAVTTTHVVVGALLLVTSLVLTLRSYRYLGAPIPPIGEAILSERVSP